MPSFPFFWLWGITPQVFFTSKKPLTKTFTHFVGNFHVKCRKLSHLIIQ